MTLHWWMHWFWVTALLYLLLCSGGVEPAPQTEEGLHPVTAGIQPETLSVRQGRAMYYTKTPYTAPKTTLQPVNNTTTRNNATEPNPVIENTNKTEILNKTLITVEPVNATEVTKPLEITQNKTVTNTTKAVEITNNTETNVTESHTTPEITENTTIAEKKNDTIISAEVKEIENNLEGASESRIVTEKPLSLETSFLQTRIPPSIESSKRVTDQSEFRGMDTGAIAGISFAALVVVALVGSTGFVLYRRRYLNKPQTLNDKCSNPDSSGYLDDSTIRDNSEEMYSLDNDSFLNSLEAMTIQNYWTDTVKHTKL